MKKTLKQQAGFSLVETLVAITILMLVIVGPMSISSSTAKGASFASEQVVAFFLAQEGAELAQKARDDIIIRKFLNPPIPNTWTTFSNTTGTYRTCFEPNGCRLELNDAGDLSVATCGMNVTFCRLNYASTPTRSYYTYQAGGTSPYTRVIKFSSVSPDEIKVTSEVTWRSGNQRDSQKAVVETYLFNVYGNN
jgi:type II secretory pathway pseudopilin PulG